MSCTRVVGSTRNLLCPLLACGFRARFSLLIVISSLGLVGGAQKSDAASQDVYNLSNVVIDANLFPPPGNKAVYYSCSDVTFNGRIPESKIILFYFRYSVTSNDSSASYVTLIPVGGLTVEPSSGRADGYFNSTNCNSKYPTQRVQMFPGEVPTNGLNDASFWVGGQDFNGNGKVGTFDSSFGIIFEPGEMISNKFKYVESEENQIVFSNMPAFSTEGTGPVSIASIKIKGYQDFNGNNIPDYYEAKYPSIIGKANTNDADGDGLSDYQEWIADTDPTNANSRFRIDLLSQTNGVSVTWKSVSGRKYDLYSKTNLTDAAWIGMTNLDGTGDNMVCGVDTSVDQRFYRVRVNLSTNEIVNP